MIKVWVDDEREMPHGYDMWIRSVVDATHYLRQLNPKAEVLLDLDHDAGNYSKLGGDYYKILDWCERHGYNPTVHIHTMNVVGRMNMEAICRRNGWKIVK